MLFREGYVPGGIKRKELKDYPQYRRYEFGEVFVDRIVSGYGAKI